MFLAAANLKSYLETKPYCEKTWCWYVFLSNLKDLWLGVDRAAIYI